MSFWRTKKVWEETGLSRTTIWRLEQAGKFPRRRQLTPGRVGWLESEVLEWMESRPPVGRDRSGEADGS